MGQRTQIIVIKENNKGEVKKTVWHHQWGFGRNMYLALMSLFIADYSKDTFAKDYNFLDTSFPTIPKLYNITDDIMPSVLASAKVDNLASIRSVFNECDNNNGGLVIHVKENDEEYLPSRITIGFLMGYEDEYSASMDGKEVYNEHNKDEKPFARWLTPAEYGKINGGSNYSDEEFIEMIDEFCTYFDIKTFENDEK